MNSGKMQLGEQGSKSGERRRWERLGKGRRENDGGWWQFA